MAFVPYDYSTWLPWQFAVWAVVVLGGLEILSFLVNHLDLLISGKINAGGPVLEKLSTTDKAFIVFNKLSTTVFTYNMVQVAYLRSHVAWDLADLSLLNTVGSLVAFFVFYDFFYTLFHWALHIPAFYPLVHKHHHRQIVPFRGNLDAVNVHPFEFIVGEYLHIVAVYFIPCHVVTVALFVIIGGVLASLNHTRFDACLSAVYQVRYHDLHHRLPRVNYGQYIMLWDRAFGTFQPYSKLDVKSTD